MGKVPIKFAGLTKVEYTFVKRGETCSVEIDRPAGLYDFRLKNDAADTAEMERKDGLISGLYRYSAGKRRVTA